MAEYTPGPWTLDATDPETWGIVHDRADGTTVVAHVPQNARAASHGEAVHNAHLLGAAPDLLAACEALVAFEVHNHACLLAAEDWECDECNTLALAASGQVRAAVRKARGEVQR